MAKLELINSLRDRLDERRTARSIKRRFANPRTTPLYDYKETWTPEEEDRLAFVDRWTRRVGHPEAFSGCIPLSAFEGNSASTVGDIYADLLENFVHDGRELLMLYPTERRNTVTCLAGYLGREFIGRLCATFRTGVAELDDDDRYVLNLIDEGSAIEGVPWSILRYRFDGKCLARSHYVELKQAVLKASLGSKEETLSFMNRVLSEYWLRYRLSHGQPRQFRTPEEDRWNLENYLVDKRLYDIVFPDGVRVHAPKGVMVLPAWRLEDA